MTTRQAPRPFAPWCSQHAAHPTICFQAHHPGKEHLTGQPLDTGTA